MQRNISTLDPCCVAGMQTPQSSLLHADCCCPSIHAGVHSSSTALALHTDTRPAPHTAARLPSDAITVIHSSMMTTFRPQHGVVPLLVPALLWIVIFGASLQVVESEYMKI